jgi:hypothetical protein
MKKIIAYKSKDGKIIAENGRFVAQKEFMQELEDWMFELSMVTLTPLPNENDLPVHLFKEKIEYFRIVALMLRPKLFWKLLKIKRRFDKNLKRR